MASELRGAVRIMAAFLLLFAICAGFLGCPSNEAIAKDEKTYTITQRGANGKVVQEWHGTKLPDRLHDRGFYFYVDGKYVEIMGGIITIEEE